MGGDDKKDLESECNDSPSGMNPIIVYSIIAVVALIGGFVLGMMLCGGSKGTEILVMRNEAGEMAYGSKIDKTDKLPAGEVKVGEVNVREGIAKQLATFVNEMSDVDKKPTASKTVTFTVKYQGQKGAKPAKKGKSDSGAEEDGDKKKAKGKRVEREDRD